jgi:hypothetical protein
MFEARFQSFEDHAERAASAQRVKALRTELARRGFRDVTGLDRSRYLIRLGRETGQADHWQRALAMLEEAARLYARKGNLPALERAQSVAEELAVASSSS